MKTFAQEEIFNTPSPKVLEFQKLMATNPLGVSYNGPQNGIINQQLLDSLRTLEEKLPSLRGKLVFYDDIHPSANVNMIKQLIKQPAAALEKGSNKIIEFKKYFSSLGFYVGDVNDPTPDPNFIRAVQAIEKRLSQWLQKISPSAGPDIFVGRIWKNGQINPQTSPQDLERAITLLNQLSLKKSAHTHVDMFDAEEYYEQQPIAVKPMPTKEDHGGDGTLEDDPHADPATTQQMGEFQQKVPEKMPVMGMDDRVVGLAKIMHGISL